MTRTTIPEATAHELTFEEYMALPETMTRQEVVDGVIVMCPTPTYGHQRILNFLNHDLFDHVYDHDLGEIILSPADVLIRKQPKLRTRQPDLMYLSAAKAAGLDWKRINILEVAPDLAVEILSPSETKGRWQEKLNDYASIGVAELWLIDPEDETVEVLALRAGRYERVALYGQADVLRSTVLPDLELPVGRLFR